MPGRCGTICSSNSGGSPARARPPVTILIVIRRAAVIFTIAETKPLSGYWRPLFAMPDISASRLGRDAFLDSHKDFLITQLGGLFPLAPLAKVGDRTLLADTCRCTHPRVEVPLHSGKKVNDCWMSALHQRLGTYVLE